MSRRLTFGCVLTALVALSQTGAAANGEEVSAPSSSSSMSSSVPDVSPERLARESYNSGIDHRNKGAKLEDQAATQLPKDAENTKKKAVEEFTKALKDFQKAADLDPSLYQAFNGMGYAYRKTGNYTKALENYDKALKMSPNFPDAMEYRGEAYLGLNRVDDAKASYLALFAVDRKQADDLLRAMAVWVAKHRTTAGGVDPAVVSALDAWVKERAKIATMTMAMSLAGNRSIWK